MAKNEMCYFLTRTCYFMQFCPSGIPCGSLFSNASQKMPKSATRSARMVTLHKIKKSQNCFLHQIGTLQNDVFFQPSHAIQQPKMPNFTVPQQPMPRVRRAHIGTQTLWGYVDLENLIYRMISENTWAHIVSVAGRIHVKKLCCGLSNMLYLELLHCIVLNSLRKLTMHARHAAAALENERKVL